MTIKECIDIVENIKPNQCTVADKVRWLSAHDMGIINDVLKTHEGYDGRYDLFEGYSEDKLSVALIVPYPYDKLYPEYLKMKIDFENGEMNKYNASSALYNSYLMDFRKYYNKTHMPLDVTRRGYRAEPPKKHTVGLTAAEYENLKRDIYKLLSEDVDEAVSSDKLYDIVTTYVYNNIEMLKGADGKTPVKRVDYFTEEDVDAMVNEVLAYENIKFAEIDADMGKVNEKLGLHADNKDNPHAVTAEQVGAYTKEEVDKKLGDVDVNVDLSDYVKNTDYATADKGGVIRIRTGYGFNISNGILSIRGAKESNIDAKSDEFMPITPKYLEYAVAKGGEGHFAKEDAVFETGSFGWTDFEYTADEDAYADIGEDYISAASSYPITVHCKGKVIGFTASCNGSYYKLTVNGNNVLENVSWSAVSQNYTLPLTLMTEDIVVELSASQIDFTDMTIQSIKGVSELESQIGDIDTALDSILDIQNGLIGGDAV